MHSLFLTFLSSEPKVKCLDLMCFVISFSEMCDCTVLLQDKHTLSVSRQADGAETWLSLTHQRIHQYLCVGLVHVHSQYMSLALLSTQSTQTGWVDGQFPQQTAAIVQHQVSLGKTNWFVLVMQFVGQWTIDLGGVGQPLTAGAAVL